MSVAPGNSSNRSTFQRRSETPRKVRGGLKLAGTLLDQAATESINDASRLARRFQALWESALDDQTMIAGLEYAKAGQIIDIDFRTGAIEAHVQGTLPKPYLVQLHFSVLSDEQWLRAIESMAGEAMFVAKLLAGELPPAIDERLKERGIEFLPQSGGELRATCTCASAATQTSAAAARCKHVGAVACLAAERIAAQPIHMLTLLGRSPQQVLELLRQARANHDSSSTSDTTGLMLHDDSIESPLMETCIDDFWRSPMRGDEWNQMPNSNSSHYVPHALLRRLGPSPMNGKFPLVGLLASVYDTVAAAARQTTAESEQTTDTDPNR